jgi:hypothetical protein
MNEPPPIPPDYYWQHFRTVVDTSVGTQRHLFSADELAAIEGLLTLPRPCQMLYVRLLNRRGELFRTSKLDYPEIGDLGGPLEQLRAEGFVDLDPRDALEDGSALAMLTVPELRGLADRLELDRRGRRDEVFARLLEVPQEQLAPLVADADHFVRQRQYNPFLLAQVVFFGNRHQDHTAFVLVDLEVSAYEAYPISHDAPLFEDREALARYLAAANRWDEGWLAWEEGDGEQLAALGQQALTDLARRPVLAPHRRRVDPARYDERLAFSWARQLERDDDLDGAIRIYRALLDDPRSMTRASEVADRAGLALRRSERAEELAELTSPLLQSTRTSDIARFRIRRRLHLAKQGGDPRRELREPPVVEMTFPHAGYAGPKALYLVGDEALPVEEAALHELGGDGLWCENSLVSTLFGLLLWDAIFAALPGMFQTPFQDAPLDLRGETFYEQRRQLIDERLAELEQADLAAEVAAAHAAHHPRRCRGVAWDAYDVDTLCRAAVALGPHLPPILLRLARHPRRHRKGMPDLFVFTEEGPAMVEVKGPGDQVSIEQALWHDFLLREGVDVRLARIRRA